ncbi:LysR family transcriptional regulator [Paracoccus homiensis]|uniref:Transcriptional regulator, LysR family n=1 Tax=Paracoccus homiensis TaxID=364199 RepID=A0A1I0D5U7_9RHOB|nr:LysR family transcriptional regulator [Paracoccus homiensis]SET27396.1 transcriptional regulator, LysR family [Paracoccus homiensis]
MGPRQLSHFLAVCRAGSISAAAQSLRIAQPALSKQIAQLEHDLGAELFQRHSRGVSLTRAGQRLRDEAADLLRRMDQIRQAVTESEDTVTGEVTLAVIPSLAAAIAGEIYPLAERKYPQMRLRIIDYPSDRARHALQRHDADLAIIPNAATDLPQAGSIPLFEEAFHYVTRIAPGARNTPISFAEAVARPLVLPFVNRDLRRRIEETARAIGVVPNVKYETGSVNVVSKLIDEGLAGTIVPLTFWLDKIATGTVSVQPVTRPAITRTHSLCWLKDRAQSPAATALRDLLPGEIDLMLAAGKLSGNKPSP